MIALTNIHRMIDTRFEVDDLEPLFWPWNFLFLLFLRGRYDACFLTGVFWGLFFNVGLLPILAQAF